MGPPFPASPGLGWRQHSRSRAQVNTLAERSWVARSKFAIGAWSAIFTRSGDGAKEVGAAQGFSRTPGSGLENGMLEVEFGSTLVAVPNPEDQRIAKFRTGNHEAGR